MGGLNPAAPDAGSVRRVSSLSVTICFENGCTGGGPVTCEVSWFAVMSSYPRSGSLYWGEGGRFVLPKAAGSAGCV